MASVTIELSPQGGSLRPFGYGAKQALDGTTTDVIFLVPTDCMLVGLTVNFSSGSSYWVYGSTSSPTDIKAGNGVYIDIIGDGTAAQTEVFSGQFLGGYNAIKVTRVSGSPSVEITSRRN